MAAYREIFTAHLDSADGCKGLARALAAAAIERGWLLCFEKSAAHCHRSMVVGRIEAMAAREIVHLRVGAGQAHPAQAAFEF
jgi:hypothetical protein